MHNFWNSKTQSLENGTVLVQKVGGYDLKIKFKKKTFKRLENGKILIKREQLM